MAGLGWTAASTSRARILQPLVLVVDDDPGVCAALVALLAPRLEPLYRVEAARSAEKALEILDAEARGDAAPLALVVTDELMPGISGTDLLVALRQHPEHRDGGRIVITAYASLASAQRAINEAEVDRYFPKPWDAEAELLPAVGRILQRFVERRGFDRFLIASQVRSKAELASVRRLRESWWSFVSLAEDGLDPASQASASDEGPDAESAVHFVVHRVGRGAEIPVATARLRPRHSGDWVLEGMAFEPEEATADVETLLVRVAVLHAAEMGAARVSTAAPALRRSIYADLGFAPTSTGAEDFSTGKLDRDIDPPGSLRMDIAPHRLQDAAGEAWGRRYATEKRLCACFQLACPARDYAAEVRGYYCPIDVHDGRLPAGFPSPSQ